MDERAKIDSRLGHGGTDIEFCSLYFNIHCLDLQK